MAPTPVSYTDLLIIGAGPAGVMAAAWASQFPIRTRIVDKNDSKVMKGRADGLQARTLEILDSFGVADYVWKKGFHDIEIVTWSPDDAGRLHRKDRVLSQKVGLSRFTQACINQGIIEQTFLDFLKTKGKVQVERSMVPEELILDHSIAEKADEYPITVKIRHVQKEINRSNQSGTHYYNHSHGDVDAGTKQENGSDGGQLETIKAKYVVGCDGAHSWTRRRAGLSLEGKQTDHIWGVMDIVPLTNFPDIRQACAINSASCGSILNVPREDRLNRLYIQLSDQGSNFDRSQITPRTILAAAQRIMDPYTLDFKHCDWWSVYQIGQRIAPQFSVANRIFLAGDAVHTHSPKLGQGMNVSMQDSYNLGWKLGAVINGIAKPEILQTYQTERRQVALDLLAADEQVSRFYTRGKTAVSTTPATNGVDPEILDFGAMRDQMHDFLSGVGVTYKPSVLVAASGHASPASTSKESRGGGVIAQQELAPHIVLGRRIPSYKIVNQAEARPVHLGEILASDGRWRLLVFAGDLRDRAQWGRVQRLGERLAGPHSLLRRYTPRRQRIDAVIEVLTIHAGPRTGVELLDLHEVFHPWDEERGWDYGKVWVDDGTYHEGWADAYRMWGVDRARGCLVVVRPDQHVGFVGELEDLGGGDGEGGVEGFFKGVLVEVERVEGDG